MKTHWRVATILRVLLTGGLLASCQKPFHEETEHYTFVTVNTTLPYWKEAQAGFLDAARVLGAQAEFVGPESYSPSGELELFQKGVAHHPSGILISPSRPEMFNDAINAAVE